MRMVESQNRLIRYVNSWICSLGIYGQRSKSVLLLLRSGVYIVMHIPPRLSNHGYLSMGVSS